MTFVDVLRPAIARNRVGLLYDVTLVVIGSVFIALFARVIVPLPFSPVPITGQTFAVLLVGVLLGSRRGGLGVLLYLLEGVAGFPFFAGGTGGLAHLAGPTGGYLIGFVVAAFTVGLLAEQGWDRRVWSTALAMLIGNTIIYAFGLPWLGHFVGAGKVFSLGLLPFIPGDLFKLGLAAITLPAGWKFLEWLGKT